MLCSMITVILGIVLGAQSVNGEPAFAGAGKEKKRSFENGRLVETAVTRTPTPPTLDSSEFDLTSLPVNTDLLIDYIVPFRGLAEPYVPYYGGYYTREPRYKATISQMRIQRQIRGIKSNMRDVNNQIRQMNNSIQRIRIPRGY